MSRPEPLARLLVVEDDPMLLELIATKLWLAGYMAIQAKDGVDAVRKLADVRPNGVILDITMPNLDGFGVLEHMRRTTALRGIPTMVLTARRETEDVKRAMALGARDYLTKPFSDQQLLSRVARLVRKLSAKA
jgi:two-component system OmpR family response regulator